MRRKGRKDLALVLNTGKNPVAAGVFTSNRFAAAPVLYSRAVLAKGATGMRAVVLNSGSANACTGENGLKDTVASAKAVAKALEIDPREVLVCSTGMIGTPLPMDKMLSGIETAAASLSEEGGADASWAILTTDNEPKTVHLHAEDYEIAGMAKGAGMLAPALATMLCVITTDALLDAETAQKALELACAKTFNRLDSDGCMSTNDTVLLLASGESGIVPSGFTEALTQTCAQLARKLADDAEGAQHTVEIAVTEAESEAGALIAAKTISRSNLVKTAIAGCDPNWGRIVSELGTVPESVCPYDPSAVSVLFNGVQVCKNGAAWGNRQDVPFESRDVHLEVRLGAGNAQASVLTNDLTHEYIHINADYSS
ncbi:MAG: bifunctional glutamate N-acetyltransferase/amino-acid acetyltransferase ArgJ [Varibaculum cambriense]|uniref:bifunctional glutamate N-acetyltransferase/amino-acid acetyltransferase ArgJ n=1 Tax=Varibaculum cambriense TaxID=184870 RepID=UPI00290FB26C|nr:bifunctional glutamate N-acetyltransferase/amino-acid acetyltransferase ArgJ [Varibaculum cambriense]MDU4028323.1 bifunctional glutamate N-acetyltransferase/amino-acid acetyltransferase ArgJ [Varibaculum cambriense]